MISKPDLAILMLETFKKDETLPQHVVDNYNMAIKAIRKQIPIKPIIKTTKRRLFTVEQGNHFKIETWMFCGRCGHLLKSKYDYCSYCGNAIDRSEEDQDASRSKNQE